MHEGIEQSLLELHGEEMGRDFRREALFEHLRPVFPRTGRVIDVGCGTGFMVEKMCRLGLEVVGLEVSETLLEFAREKMAASRYSPTLVDKGIESASEFAPADLVICLDVIEHIEDDEGALVALKEACRGGANLILTVPALPVLYSARDRKLGHHRRYTKSGLKTKMERAGFVVDECYYWNAIGVPYYGLFGKVLRRDVADNLRQGEESMLKKIVREMVKVWLAAEGRFRRLPFGLTLIAVARARDC